MQKRIVAFVISAFLLSGCVYGQYRHSADGVKLEQTLQMVKSLYVDDADTKKLTEVAIRAMLEELDPHSSYLNEEEVRAMNEPLEGNFEGVGISFSILTDTVYVMEVITGGPSQKVGLMPGDKIIRVNDSIIAGVKIKNKDVINKLRGPKGTKVNVSVMRRGMPDLIEFQIVRDRIPITSIDAAYMVSDDTGYIRLSRFGMTSGDEFKKAEKELRALGMEHLILDLTDNGGGILQVANEIVDEFLEEGKLIVYTEGKNQPRFKMNATGSDELKGGKLVVLVNGSSASASEILAGAIQDWDRGVIVGRRTFGKGLVQRQLPLSDGTMIRLTVARYYTPTGRSIQRPYESGNLEAYNQDFLSRYHNGELFAVDSIHFPDSLRYTTLINERTVYGGGGIMPDYYVEMDTTSRTILLSRLHARNLINRVVIEELDKHRGDLTNKYTDVTSFIEGYKVSSGDIKSRLQHLADEADIKWSENEYSRSQSLIDLQVKALMARDLFDASAFFRVINQADDIFKEGLSIIMDEKRYQGLLEGVGGNVGVSQSTP